MIEDFKPLLASRTVWSNLVGLAAFILSVSGLPVDAIGDQGAVVDAVLQIVAGGSFLASTLFRVIATRRLT
jgi:hypothetical protein